MAFVIPIAFFDLPQVIDCTVTPIPPISDEPLQVVADTGLQTGVGIQYVDSTGDFIGIYIGSPGFEKLLCVVGNGGSGQNWSRIPANSRISLRSMNNVPVTNGLFHGAVVSI